ncbi:MAG: hypothetical protein ACI9G1_005805, partial [Pirellulaceae bacterium]
TISQRARSLPGRSYKNRSEHTILRVDASMIDSLSAHVKRAINILTSLSYSYPSSLHFRLLSFLA